MKLELLQFLVGSYGTLCRVAAVERYQDFFIEQSEKDLSEPKEQKVSVELTDRLGPDPNRAGDFPLDRS